MFLFFFAAIESVKRRIREAPPKALLEALARLKGGDREALTVVLELVQGRLYRFCFYLTRTPAAAEELAQDVLLRALGRISELEEPEKIFSWLFRVARNLLVDEKRKPESKLSRAEVSGSDEAAEFLASIPDDRSDAREAALEVRQALAGLSADERAVLLLVDYEEYTYDEAAETLGISASTVKLRLGKARRAFMAAYQEKAG